MPFQSNIVQTLDEDQAEIIADYRITCERAKKHAEERLALHRVKRGQLLALIAAVVAGGAASAHTKKAA